MPAQLKEKEKDVDSLLCDPSYDVDTIFNKIQDFQDLCVMIENPKTDTQLVTYAYLIFTKMWDVYGRFKVMEQEICRR